MTAVTLFGVGSPIVVDVEETCGRAGWSITAGINNVASPVYVSAAVPVRPVTPGLTLAGEVLLPLFSPANRRLAWRRRKSPRYQH